MLNEELEYGQYTGQMDLEFSSGKTDRPYPRIIPSLVISEHGAGIPRALWIIARHGLQECHYWDTSYLAENNKDSSVEDVRKNLREGVLKKMKDWYADDSVLAGFYRKNCGKMSNKDTNKWEDFISGKKTTWENENFYGSLFRYKTNETSLERILCEAVHAGPLRNMAVVCNSSFIMALKENFVFQSWSTDKNNPKESFLLEADNTITSKNYSYLVLLLKMICAWLLKDNYGIVIRRTDLANWMNFSAFGSSNERWKFFYEYPENGCGDQKKRTALLDLFFPETLSKRFSEEKLRGNKDICNKILDEYGLKIVNADDISRLAGKDEYFILEEKEFFGPAVTDYIVRLFFRDHNGESALTIV